jgi:hypothetical protein
MLDASIVMTGPWFPGHIRAVLLFQAFCHLEQNENATNTCYTTSAVLRGYKNSRMYMKVPSTTTLSFPTLSPLLTVGKNIVGYFVDRRHTYAITIIFLILATSQDETPTIGQYVYV